jgi:hypothetical protein
VAATTALNLAKIEKVGALLHGVISYAQVLKKKRELAKMSNDVTKSERHG